MWRNPMTSVPGDGEANLSAGRPMVKKNMSVPHTTSNGSLSLLLSNRRRSNGMDQQEADDQHHRAGYAMN
jgi:hypothetical protein